MDLLSIGRVLSRHKLLVMPVLAVIVAGVVYFAVFAKPLYQTTVDYVLAPPPNPPTATQIAQDPSLGSENSSNVFSRFYDQSIVADAIVERMSSQSTQAALLKAGADPRNSVTPIALNGSTEPIVEVLGTGPSAVEALKTRDLVSNSLANNLYELQRSQGTNPTYMFKLLPVASSAPQVKASSKIRSIVALLGLGVLVLFIAVSLGDAIDKKREERRAEAEAAMGADGDEPHGQRSGGDESRSRPSPFIVDLSDEQAPERADAPIRLQRDRAAR